MIKADKYILETIEDILENGSWDKDPRPRWSDGAPAHSKFITQAVFKYDISKEEFPITTLRKTALKGAYYDIEAIYQKQTNVIEEMHSSIHSWWEDFVVESWEEEKISITSKFDWEYYLTGRTLNSLGQTYGHTVKRYKLIDNLLYGLESSPFSRRHIMNLWDNKQMEEDKQALVPCAYQTLWSVREKYEVYEEDKHIPYSEPVHYIDITLNQRSQDFMMTASINPAQYIMLGMMVCGHLTHTTGITHKLGNFLHIVQNCHIYNRHIPAAKELLKRESINEQPTVRLKENKNFYDYTIDDFEFNIPKGIKNLPEKLELAV